MGFLNGEISLWPRGRGFDVRLQYSIHQEVNCFISICICLTECLPDPRIIISSHMNCEPQALIGSATSTNDVHPLPDQPEHAAASSVHGHWSRGCGGHDPPPSLWSLPAMVPAAMVARAGDWRLLSLDRKVNSKPSRAMAYRMRGSGNMEPRRLEGKSQGSNADIPQHRGNPGDPKEHRCEDYLAERAREKNNLSCWRAENWTSDLGQIRNCFGFKTFSVLDWSCLVDKLSKA